MTRFATEAPAVVLMRYAEEAVSLGVRLDHLDKGISNLRTGIFGEEVRV